MCFLVFYNSTDLLRAYFSTLRQLPGLFLHPHRVELLTYPSVYRVCLHTIGLLFPCIFVVLLLIINLVSINLFLGVMLGLDLWIVDVNIILAFGFGQRVQVLAWGSQPSIGTFLFLFSLCPLSSFSWNPSCRLARRGEESLFFFPPPFPFS